MAQLNPAPPKNTVEERPLARDGRGRFGKGNPGRPCGSANKANRQLRQAAQAYTADALETLVEVMTDPQATAASRVAAAIAILDRGHGKPTQQVSLPDPPSGGFRIVLTPPDPARRAGDAL